MEVFDANIHLGTGTLALHLGGRTAGVDDLIREMDRCGVSRAAVSGAGPADAVAALNDAVAAACRAHPGRLLGYYRPVPWEPDAAARAEDALASGAFRALFLDPVEDGYCPLLEPGLPGVLQAAERHAAPVYVRCGIEPWTMPGQVADLAAQFPKVRFLLGHCALNQLYQHVLTLAGRHDNLWLESSIGPAMSCARAWGADRVLFGSDWPTTSLPTQLRKVLDSGFAAADQARMLWENAARVFGGVSG